MSSKDPLGDRMKGYENVYRHYLPRRTYTILRIDGKSFHNYLNKAERPYDKSFIHKMGKLTEFLCKEIQGAVLGYCQSDEVSILLTDFGSPHSEPWFGGNIQKMTSVSASMATAYFNELNREYNLQYNKTAYFDSRVFEIEDRTEVYNSFLWRQNDCTRNSVSLLAQSYFSHKQLQHKKTNDLLCMLSKINKPWENEDESFRRGQLITQEPIHANISYTHRKTGEQKTVLVERNVWLAKPAFFFSDLLFDFIPVKS